jgi:hypothetical protein
MDQIFSPGARNALASGSHLFNRRGFDDGYFQRLCGRLTGVQFRRNLRAVSALSLRDNACAALALV